MTKVTVEKSNKRESSMVTPLDKSKSAQKKKSSVAIDESRPTPD